MKEEPVFLVSEVWLKPGSFEEFKDYRISLLNILEHTGAEYVYHGHPFEWVLDSSEKELPTGIEILRFASENQAREAVKILAKVNHPEETHPVFRRIRCYLSRYAPPADLQFGNDVI